MSSIQQINPIEQALVQGNLANLNADQRLSYIKQVCESVGLNWLTKPFEYITLNGKLVLYATRAATDQLRSVHKVSIKITSREKFDDIYVVTAQATNADGRFDESTGAVNVAGLKGDNLANAYLKAETKAKRRVTLSLCGLGLLDESEIETIQDAKPFVESAQPSKPVNTSAAIQGHNTEVKQAGPASLGDYVVNFGRKLKGLKLSEIKDFELKGYLNYLESESKASGKPLTGSALELYEKGSQYLASIQAPEDDLDAALFNSNEKMPE